MRVSIEIPENMADRAERISDMMLNEAARKQGTFRYRRNEILVAAMQRGLDQLENELAEIDQTRTNG